MVVGVFLGGNSEEKKKKIVTSVTEKGKGREHTSQKGGGSSKVREQIKSLACPDLGKKASNNPRGDKLSKKSS